MFFDLKREVMSINEKPRCMIITYYEEFTEEIEQCDREATWQGDGGGFACDNHKDSLINPKPLDAVVNN